MLGRWIVGSLSGREYVSEPENVKDFLGDSSVFPETTGC